MRSSYPLLQRSFANAPGTVDGLSPFTEYTCTISASTVSPGPVSDPITVRTAQSGMARSWFMDCIVCKLYCQQILVLQSLTQWSIIVLTQYLSTGADLLCPMELLPIIISHISLMVAVKAPV